MDKFCDHCKTKSHTADQCFKIYRYLDWYKGRISKGGTNFADLVMIQVVCQEVLKSLKDKGIASSEPRILVNFAGNLLEPPTISNIVGAFI